MGTTSELRDLRKELTLELRAVHYDIRQSQRDVREGQIRAAELIRYVQTITRVIRAPAGDATAEGETTR